MSFIITLLGHISGPFVVAFVETAYTVDESMSALNVCVNLTQPLTDILDETVNVYVIDDSHSIYIPSDATLASKILPKFLAAKHHTVLLHSPAPDEPNLFSIYPMVDGSDYAQQKIGVNVIDDLVINATRRIICYNQPIYEDLRLEPNEYAGLTLGVIDNVRTTITTHVKPMYDQASILILDNDSECFIVHLVVYIIGLLVLINTINM